MSLTSFTAALAAGGSILLSTAAGTLQHSEVGSLPATTRSAVDPPLDRLPREFCGNDGNALKFALDGRWPGNTGDPIELTWSFVPDSVGNSVLFSTLDAQFAGSPDPRAAWIQVFQDGFDRWDDLSGVNFTRVVVADDADSGAFWGAVGQEDLVGDIRIRMTPTGGSIAIANPPNQNFPAGQWGDITLDTTVDWSNPFPTSGYPNIFENTVMHSLGHSLGLAHVCPIDGTKLMEGSSAVLFYGPQHDDVRGIHEQYGDYLEPNDSFDEAAFVPVGIGMLMDLAEVDQSMGSFGPGQIDTGRLSIDSPDDEDFYVFQYGMPVALSVSISKIGTTYNDNPETCGVAGDQCCSGHTTFSSSIADLQIELYDRNHNLLQSGVIGYQLTTVNAPYYVRVFTTDTGFFEPQTYKMVVDPDPGVPCENPNITCNDNDPTNGTEDCVNGSCVVTYTSGDCNNNQLEDSFDISSMTSLDCNSNGIPDECEADCDGDGVPDQCEIASGSSSDDNFDGIPDDCQFDCNANGILDEFELDSTTDTNDNGVLDQCETDRYVPVTPGLTSHSTLSEALMAAGPGDTIHVAPGTYSGPGFRNLALSDRIVQIIGAGAEVTIINLEQDGRFAIATEQVAPAKCLIDGFTFLNGRVDENDPIREDGGAIWVYEADVEIAHCIFEGNQATGFGGAIALDASSVDVRIRSCLFFDNASRQGGAIFGSYDSAATILNCTFVHNSSVLDPTGQFYGKGSAIFGSDWIVDSCIIRNNPQEAGDQLELSPDSWVKFNNLPNAELANWTTPPLHVGNIAANARFVNGGNDNFHIKGNSPCRNTGNQVHTNYNSRLDIDLKKRVEEGRVDMGSDEFKPVPPAGGPSGT